MAKILPNNNKGTITRNEQKQQCGDSSNNQQARWPQRRIPFLDRFNYQVHDFTKCNSMLSVYSEEATTAQPIVVRPKRIRNKPSFDEFVDVHIYDMHQESCRCTFEYITQIQKLRGADEIGVVRSLGAGKRISAFSWMTRAEI
jgi:hypothetical protein